ncbi:MAG TPA: ribosome recycling factor [Chloroflexi bacterium]|nr:ribosome recycling factor [Chloroflexota bacterium]
MINDVLNETRVEMQKSLESLSNDLSGIRTGRASASLVEKIRVNYYDMPTPMQQLALISVPEAQLITIRPYDPSAIKNIERAILQSDLGITPNNDGKLIRLQIPSLTEERRKTLAKQVHARVEDARVSIRNHRRDGLEYLRELEKEKEIAEDDFYNGKDKLQDLTNESIKKADGIGKTKEEEIMSI